MAWSVVQHAFSTGSTTRSYVSTPTAGNLLICVVYASNGGTITLSDSGGNAWIKTLGTQGLNSGDNTITACFYCLSANGNASTLTIGGYGTLSRLFIEACEVAFGAGATYAFDAAHSVNYSGSYMFISSSTIDCSLGVSSVNGEFRIAGGALFTASRALSPVNTVIDDSGLYNSTCRCGVEYVTTTTLPSMTCNAASYYGCFFNASFIGTQPPFATTVAQQVGGLRQAISATVGTLYPGERFIPTLREAATIGVSAGERIWPVPVVPQYHYAMRRTDTGVAGGFVAWVNTTGDSTGSPVAVGVQGPPMILGRY